MTEKQIHSRGYLPHVNGADFQFITYRLYDSLPIGVLESMTLFESKQKHQQINYYLDKGLGSCILKEPFNASIVIENWEHFNGERYDICAYVVMPNHVHILIKVYPDFNLSEIIHSWKSYTAKKMATTKGQNIWYRDYFDRYIRDEGHYNQTVEYIRLNPVKAGLVANSEDWAYLLVMDKF